MWTLDFDDFAGRFCYSGSYPLVNHLRNALGKPLAIIMQKKTIQLIPSSIICINVMLNLYSQVSLPSPPLRHVPPRPLTPSPLSVLANQMGCTPTLLMKPLTSSASVETHTCINASLVWSMLMLANVVIGLECKFKSTPPVQYSCPLMYCCDLLPLLTNIQAHHLKN